MLKVREVRATLILFLTVIIFLLCWVPAVLILVVHKIRPILGTVTEMFLVCTLLIGYSMINPVIYVFTLKDIRKAFKKFVSCESKGCGKGMNLEGNNMMWM